MDPNKQTKSQSARTNSRVCDACIRKKVKCNQTRPTCSRCFERGETCTYSTKRRKPGPAPHSHRDSIPSRPQTSSDDSLITKNSVKETHYPNNADITLDPLGCYVEPAIPVSTAAISSDPPIAASNPLLSHGILDQTFPVETQPAAFNAQDHISHNEEELLIEKYFEIAQDASPIFSKERFLFAYRNSHCNSNLISTITTITARLTKHMSVEESTAIDTRIDSLSSLSTVQENLLADFPSLDQFRESCVLAFYEFNQFPGSQSWMRIGNLARMAYRVGLDRIESLRAHHVEWQVLSPEDMEEWRAVWWCIYRLDSYSNISSGTPYLINEEFINTALILQDPANPKSVDSALPQVHLATFHKDLWKLVPAVTSHPATLVSNIHNITITALRQVGVLARFWILRPQEQNIERVANVERQLAALRLALPQRWLNSHRDAFSHESHAHHHARLVTVLHVLMTRLMLSILSCNKQQDEEWLMSWQKVLEASQDIASVSEQWDSSFCLKTDPAISFVVFTAYIFLDLHKKCTPATSSALHSQIDHDKTVLRLHIQHFASIWTLPRLLNMSLATFSESIPDSLSYQHIRFILSRFEGPLHPRWLQFLSTSHSFVET